MSLVIAIEHAGGVLLACDSFVGNSSHRDVYAGVKWELLSPQCALGFVGDLGVIAVVCSMLPTLAGMVFEDSDAAARTVALSIRRWLKEEEVVKEEADATQFLLVTEHRAYVLGCDGSVVRSTRGVLAIGADADIALGALAVLPYSSAPTDAARRALEAAAEVGQWTIDPFHFLYLTRALPPNPHAEERA